MDATNLKRVQVYLDKDDVRRVSEMADLLRIKRSQIIRDATKAVAERYSLVIQVLGKKKTKRNPLLDLVGIEKSKTGTVGLNVDEIYDL
jgi:hypothetical protein